MMKRMCIGLLLFLVMFSAIVIAEQGQYRSKVLLSPLGEVDEGVGLSIEELEQQINSIDQPYARSSAGRHLARHYVAQGEYDKAVVYYQTALAAQGLSDIANREMLRELAQVQLLKEEYSAAVVILERVLHIDLVAEAADYLLLAQAHHRLSQFVDVVVVLDGIAEKGLTLTVEQMRQALALYYSAGAFAQCEDLLQRLLKLEPDNPENWHLLVSMYLQQDKKRLALDRLALAREKAVPFTESDVLLLVDLQAANGNPYVAAEILAMAIGDMEVEASGEHYRKLFELWYQAQEKGRAQDALVLAAQLTGDTELYLYLAQLQMDGQAWTAMHRTVLQACDQQLQDRYVSRANLLLGVSQLKLGNATAARRSFINASLIGGSNGQAGQWLNYMAAEPASKEESRRIVGACYGSQGKRAAFVAIKADAVTTVVDLAEMPSVPIETKTVSSIRLYYFEPTLPFEQLGDQLKSLVMQLSISLVKARGTAVGPLHIIYSTGLNGDNTAASLQLAFPVRGLPAVKGRYKTRRADVFKCAYLDFHGPAGELHQALMDFYQTLVDEGFELTGESRTLISTGANKDKTLNAEFQLGIF